MEKPIEKVKPKKKMITPDIKTVEDAVEFLGILSMYNSIKQCHRFRYYEQQYMTAYNKVQKSILIVEEELNNNADFKITKNVASVLVEYKAKPRNK